MLARLLLVAAALFAPFTVRADVSPEYYQLLSDINGTLKVLGPSLTRGPVCAPEMVEMAKRGIQGNLFSTAATKVVVEPLETGAKVAAGALGVESAIISTYSLVRCGMSESSPEGFAKCALGEALGYAGGEGLTAAGVGNLSGAVAGAAWDKAYGAMRGAIEDYGRQSETVEWTASGACDVTVLAHWNKRPRPDAAGGKITLSVRAENCKCATGNSLKRGSLRFSVPVHYDRAGASQPGWRAGTPAEYMLEAQCCAQSRSDGRVHLYDPAGQLRAPQPPQAETPQPPSAAPAASPPNNPTSTPVGTSSVSAPPPIPSWSVDNPCPACEPFHNLMDEHLRAAADVERRAAELQQELADNQAQQHAARTRIGGLQEQLRALEGQGGSAYDPATGLTTSSTTQADGSVVIAVTDKQGREIERRTRDRRDTAQLRGKIIKEETEVAARQAAAAQLRKNIEHHHALANKHRKLAQDALQALKDCLVQQCNQAPARISRTGPSTLTTAVALAQSPVAIPPKEDILAEIEAGGAEPLSRVPQSSATDVTASGAVAKEDILSEIETDRPASQSSPAAGASPATASSATSSHASQCADCRAMAQRYITARDRVDELRGIPPELRGEHWPKEMEQARKEYQLAQGGMDFCRARCVPQQESAIDSLAPRPSTSNEAPSLNEAVATIGCSFAPAQPAVIGPKETFGNSDEKKALEAGKAVLGLVGGLFGGGGGDGGGSPFGMTPSGSDSGPDLVSNPIGDMQRFTLPGTETAIKAGARFREDGKLLVSVEVDESPDDGVVHQVELQRLVSNADGKCTMQIMRPGQWLHYGIYEKWWTKLRIQTFVNDGSGWKQTSDTGWMDWDSGTNVLDTGRIAASEIPTTGWGSMGADRAMGGPRAAGALFDPGKPAIYGKPVPERFVVHVSKPESDPVTTVPFTLYPLYWSDGTVVLQDSAPDTFVFTGPPRLPTDGGMTQIDPPSTPPPREDILNEIDYVPIRQ